MFTQGGEPFFPADPRPEEIRLEDIGHSLSLQCRFNGHTREFYSVAQHCVLLSWWAEGVDPVEALMHDAAEAYLGDLVRPVKAHCPGWMALDCKLDGRIRARFGMVPEMPPAMRRADLRMAVTERRDLLRPGPAVDWGDVPDPFPYTITPWEPHKAKALFLHRAEELGLS